MVERVWVDLVVTLVLVLRGNSSLVRAELFLALRIHIHAHWQIVEIDLQVTALSISQAALARLVSTLRSAIVDCFAKRIILSVVHSIS